MYDVYDKTSSAEGWYLEEGIVTKCLGGTGKLTDVFYRTYLRSTTQKKRSLSVRRTLKTDEDYNVIDRNVCLGT